MCVPHIGAVHIQDSDEDVRRLEDFGIWEIARVFMTEECGGCNAPKHFFLSFKIKVCLFFLKIIKSGATAFEAMVNLESLR